jgi:hypothetical protein
MKMTKSQGKKETKGTRKCGQRKTKWKTQGQRSRREKVGREEREKKKGG